MSVFTDVPKVGPKFADVLVPGLLVQFQYLLRNIFMTTFLYFKDACNQMHPIQISANSCICRSLLYQQFYEY